MIDKIDLIEISEIMYDEDLKKYYVVYYGYKILKNAKADFKHLNEKINRFNDLLDNEPEQILKVFVEKNRIYIELITFYDQKYIVNFASYPIIKNKRKELSDLIKNNGHKLLNTYINNSIDILVDYGCNHQPAYVSPSMYKQGHIKCPYCTHKRIAPYQDDIYTLRPDLLKYFINKEDAIGLGLYTLKKIMLRCPNCGHEKEQSITKLTSNGFSCEKCGDGKSFPERFIMSVLDQLSVEYETEKRFEWCVYYINDKKTFGIYDVFISNKKLIIEMDGRFHYNDCAYSSKEEVKKRDNIKDQLAVKNGYDIIRINCNYDNKEDCFNYIKNELCKKLYQYYDLKNLDWDKINRNSCSSLLLKACKLWNDGYNVNKISSDLHVALNTVANYLRQGSQIGLCDYSPSKSVLRGAALRKKQNIRYAKVIKENTLIGLMSDRQSFIDQYNELNSNSLLTHGNITAVLNHHQKTTKGLQFIEISKEEYDSLYKKHKDHIIT